MLIILPNKCLTCRKNIKEEKTYGEGLVQMDCKVNGFPPFEVRAVLSWCSVEHFLEWWKHNLNQLNVTFTQEEVSKEAIHRSEAEH